MRIVLICGIVRINYFGSTLVDNCGNLFNHRFIAEFYIGRGEIEVVNRAVFAYHGSFVLFFYSYGFHLLVGIVSVQAASGAACSVGYDYRRKPFVILSETFEYAVIRHKFDVVEMCRDAHMRNLFLFALR